MVKNTTLVEVPGGGGIGSGARLDWHILKYLARPGAGWIGLIK